VSSQDNRSQVEQDIRDLEKLGYVQELLRDMGGFSSFAISFSVISILTGAIQLYGYGLQHGGPLQMTLGWWGVSFFTMLVALSMAELASAYPTAGALYHWSSFLGGRSMGWFTACFNTIGQFAILAGIDCGLANFLAGLFGWPTTQGVIVPLSAALLLSHATLNHFGVRVVSILNNFSAWYHIGVVVLLFAALLSKGFVQPVSFLGTFSHTDGYAPSYSFLVGLLLAQWTLTGYDASAHVTEETLDPRRNAPWGIFIAVAVSVIAGGLMILALTLSIPDLNQVTAFGDNAFAELLKLRLGPAMGNAIVFLVAGAMWLCGLASLTSASRMVYAFARDGGLPFSKVWAKVSPRHQTPSNAIWALAGLALLLALWVSLYSAVVSLAVIALYISYGLPIVARLYARYKGHEGPPGPWNLGRLSVPVAVCAVAWIAFISVLFVLPPNGQAAIAVGVSTALLVVIWFARARTHFPGPRVQHFGIGKSASAPALAAGETTEGKLS
jgi:amino acid transporter